MRRGVQVFSAPIIEKDWHHKDGIRFYGQERGDLEKFRAAWLAGGGHE